MRRGSDGESSTYMAANPFLSQEAGSRGGGNGGGGGAQGGGSDQRQALQKQKASREWELKTSSSLGSQNLFIAAAAASSGGGILSGKVGGSPVAVSSVTGSAVGQYLGAQFPLGATSVVQSLFGAQTGSTANGTTRLVNGHSALGSFSSAGLAGGAAGGEHHAGNLIMDYEQMILR